MSPERRATTRARCLIHTDLQIADLDPAWMQPTLEPPTKTCLNPITELLNLSQTNDSAQKPVQLRAKERETMD